MTDIRVTGGIRTHNPSKRAAADPQLKRRGHWDRHIYIYIERESLFNTRLQFRHVLCILTCKNIPLGIFSFIYGAVYFERRVSNRLPGGGEGGVGCSLTYKSMIARCRLLF